jgi:hypothetical protein
LVNQRGDVWLMYLVSIIKQRGKSDSITYVPYLAKKLYFLLYTLVNCGSYPLLVIREILKRPPNCDKGSIRCPKVSIDNSILSLAHIIELNVPIVKNL